MNKNNLALARYNSTRGEWELLPSTVDTVNNKITATTTQFSKFQIVEKVPLSVVDKVFTYPNPYYVSKGGGINFARLPKDAEITIYTITGEKVFEATETDNDGYYNWDLKNSDGDTVASGVYIWIVKDTDGNKKIGKLAIIR